MTILNTYDYVIGSYPTWTWLYFIPIGFFIFAIFMISAEEDPLAISAFLISFITTIIFFVATLEPITETHYDCIVDNTTSIKEVYESGYEIVEVNGEIYTFKEREVEE